MKLKLIGLSLVALAAAAACEKTAPEPAPAPVAEPAAPPAPDYAALLLAGDRPVVDRGDDDARKPVEVLAFAQIMPGQTVFEIEAGSGYYTELLSHAVGPAGKVIMQTPEFGGFYTKDIATRLKDNRLANVRSSITNFDALDAPDGSVDVAVWFLGPHELYCIKECGGKSWGDPVKSYAEVFRILKPGGTFVILDHAAATGAPSTTGNDLHRIDPMLVKAAATTAGFVADGESKALASDADDHTKNVFDPAIRRRTDQFLLRYKKPG